MTSPIELRRRRRVSRLWIVPLVIVVLLGASFWSVLRGGDPFSPGTKTFTANGIDVSYPAGWNVNDQGWASSGLGSTFAILGTQPWGLCLPFDINCHDELKLEPSQISVALSSGIVGGGSVCDIGVDRSDLADRGAGDPPATGRLLRVDGRPTLATDYAVGQLDYYRSDAWRTWVIAAPGSTIAVYRIDARYRGPGDSAFSRQLDDMIASIRFVGPATHGDGGPDDCGSPFP